MALNTVNKMPFSQLLKRALIEGISMPALFIAISTLGYGGFAREMGFSYLETLFIIPVVWALPSQVTFISGYVQGLELLPLFLSVTFTAIRFLPMTASFLPLLKGPHTPKWRLFLYSHLVVITTWVEGNRILPHITAEQRLTFMTIYGSMLLIVSMCSGSLGFILAGTLPSYLTASLIYIIPLYFCISLLSAALKNKELIAVFAGMICFPFAHEISPEFDLIIAGLIGGGFAYLLSNFAKQPIEIPLEE